MKRSSLRRLAFLGMAGGLFASTHAFAQIALTSLDVATPTIGSSSGDLTLANYEETQEASPYQTTYVNNGPTGALLPYTPTAEYGFPLAFISETQFGPGVLQNGEVGTGNNPDDNDDAAVVGIDDTNTGSLTLTFASTETVGSVAFYDGYSGRDNGSYSLSYVNGADATVQLGEFTIDTTGSNIVDAWFTLNTPISTDNLTFTFTTTEGSNASQNGYGGPGIKQIQVFEPGEVPEPSTWAMLAGGLVALVCLGRRRLNV